MLAPLHAGRHLPASPTALSLPPIVLHPILTVQVPHGTRLYSIASTRYGDTFDGQTVSVDPWEPGCMHGLLAGYYDSA